MSISFASNLSMLRRERNISQKTAAVDLNISQALLSHYEKGIRECNLDFVAKAAKYYDVTTDFLLGISDNRHGNDDIFDFDEIPSDSQMKTKTLIRAFMYLLQKAENDNDVSEEYFTEFFIIFLEKYLCSVQKNDKELSFLCDAVLNSSKAPKNRNSEQFDQLPKFIKTIDRSAIELINKKLRLPIE